MQEETDGNRRAGGVLLGIDQKVQAELERISLLTIQRMEACDGAMSGNKRLIDTSDAACVSVGVKIVASEMISVDGEEVTSITEARIKEISLVSDPAVKGTFAAVVNLDEEDPLLWSAARSQRFKIDKLTSNVATTARRLEKHIVALNKEADRLAVAESVRGFLEAPARHQLYAA